jgi:hypothetical protein
MSQWTEDEVGPETCTDCGRPSRQLRCPACVVTHTRAYRRATQAATGHDPETRAWAGVHCDVPALFNLPPAPNGPGPAPGARLLGDCRVIDTEQRRAPDGGGA